MIFRSKAQCEGNGPTLVEHCNAVAEDHRGALRVSLSGPTGRVVLLGKDQTLASKARLAVNLDRLTEPTLGR